MGAFDNTSNKKYNNAIPNYDEEDGIDSVKCNNDECPYRDVKLDRCLFEICIQTVFPLSIPFHEKFTCKCKLCDNEMEIHFDNMLHPFDASRICDDCILKLKNLVKG